MSDSIHVMRITTKLVRPAPDMSESSALPLRLSLLSSAAGLVASQGSIKNRSSTFKTTDFSTLQKQPAITACLGQQTPTVLPLQTHTHIQTRTYKPYRFTSGPPLLLYYSHEESQHSQDKPGTLSCKQASQPRRRSVIISTMTVRVLHKVHTKCHSGGRLLSGRSCQFVPVSHTFASQIPTQLQASAFQLAEEGDNYEL